jgi:hypothetical protein
MKERPILFSGPMVRAILAGNKTKTRRVMGPQPHDAFAPVSNGVRWYDNSGAGKFGDQTIYRCPYGVPGDRLWVRETFSSTEQEGAHPSDAEWVYRATDTDWETMEGWRWKPSIHMPRGASRITLEITGIRVERLQEISQDDALAEGCVFNRGSVQGGWGVDGSVTHCSAVAAYRALWEAISGPGSWDANPFVWVVEFRQIERVAA